MRDITITIGTRKVAVAAHTYAGAAWLRKRAMAMSLDPDNVADLINEIQLAGLTVEVDHR